MLSRPINISAGQVDNADAIPLVDDIMVVGIPQEKMVNIPKEGFEPETLWSSTPNSGNDTEQQRCSRRKAIKNFCFPDNIMPQRLLTVA